MWLGHTVVLHLIFGETCKLTFIATGPVYTPTSIDSQLFLLCILANTGHFSFFVSSIIVVLTGERENLNVVLIDIVPND